MKIPFVDLKKQYESLKHEIDVAIFSVINDCSFVGGKNNPYVSKFEAEFSAYCGIKHCVTCANGTDSLEIVLKASGVGFGDEVIVPALSWISTSECVSNIGAIPVFVDILEDRFTIDPDKISAKITPATKAIIPVHLYGLCADMNRINEIARKHKLIVIEDCAQAHGAEYFGKKAGTMGDAASFSFYPGKNLGAYGDAGAIVSNNDEISEKSRMIANHGQLKKHEHIFEGRNSRMDGIQAAVLSVKLPHIDSWNNLRIKAADIYSNYLARANVTTPVCPVDYKHVFHLYVVKSNHRDKLIATLNESGIECAIHYPNPLPMLDAYKSKCYLKSDFPVAVDVCNAILSLPMFPELDENSIKMIAGSVNSVSRK